MINSWQRHPRGHPRTVDAAVGAALFVCSYGSPLRDPAQLQGPG
ncbi:hypothetical protein [Streptomyces sp.]